MHYTLLSTAFPEVWLRLFPKTKLQTSPSPKREQALQRWKQLKQIGVARTKLTRTQVEEFELWAHIQ